MADALFLHRTTQPRRPRPRVALQFFGRGGHGLARDRLERHRGTAVEILLDAAFEVAAAHEILHQAVFERVIRYDHQPPARAQHLQALFERHAQRLHLAVHLDAERLEDLREVLGFVLARRARTHGLHQVGRRGEGPQGAGPLDAVGRLPRRLHLAPVTQQARELGVRIGVGDVGRRAAAAPVHAHVEGCRAAEREAPLRAVEVVRRHPQVGQHGIGLGDAAQPQRAPHEAEVALDVVEARVVGPVVVRVAVLVEGVERPLGPEGPEDAARVSAPAEGEVDAAVRGADLHQGDRLLQQHGSMVVGTVFGAHGLSQGKIGCKVR